MEKLLTEFVHYLRQNEIRVATSSLEDALLLLPHLDMSDRFDFETTLSQLFVKHEEDIERFHLCFEEFFFRKIGDIIQHFEQQESKKALDNIQSSFESELSKKREKQRKEKEGTLSHKEQWENFLASVSFSKKNEKHLETLHETAQQAMGNHTLENARSLEGIKPKEWSDYTEALIWKAIESEQPSVIFDSIHQWHKELSTIRKEVLKVKKREEHYLNTAEKKAHSGMRKMVKTTIDVLQERPLNHLSKGEIEILREHIREHASSLLTRFSKLLKQTHLEKELDMPRIMQESVRTYGVPMDLFYVQPPKNKTKIDVVLDVSGSVVKSAELLLMFMYLLRQHFPRQVRVFSFVGLLADVTSSMDTNDWEEMLKNCLKKAPIDYRGYSNYDKAFGIYEEGYMNDVNSDTIVLLVGDARNNRNDARVETFRRLQKQAKAVYWLNPEKMEEWDTGDSVIGRYAPYATDVYECVNTKQLLQSLEQMSKEIAMIHS